MPSFIKKTSSIFFIFCLLLASTQIIFAQNTDSLITALSKEKTDTGKIKILLRLANKTAYSDPEESSKYLKQAEPLVSKNNKQKVCEYYFNMKAVISQNKGEFKQAKTFFEEALKIGKQFSDTVFLIDLLNNMGGLYNMQANQLSAIKCYLEVLNLPGIKKRPKKHAMTLHNLAGVYHDQKRYEDGLKLEFEALDIDTLIHDKKLEAYCFLGIADDYTEIGRTQDALNANIKSLKLAESLNHKSLIITNLIDMGCCYFNLKKYDLAIEYQAKGKKIAEEVGDEYSVMIALSGIGLAYVKQKDFTKGIPLIKESIAIGKEQDDKKSVRENYLNLSEIYEQQNNLKEAMKYSKLYIALNDTIFNEENTSQINDLSVKYESEKKEKEIALLNLDLLTKQKDKEVLSAQVEQKNKIIITTMASALFLIISVFLFYSRQQLKQKNQYQIDISKQQENTAIAIIQTQENERNRIAKDLHDSVGTFLSTLKINLQLLESSIPADKKTTYQNAIELADKTAVELRNITKNISNETLIESGLPDALEELVERVNRLGNVKVDFKTHGITSRLKEITEINLYRVAQELITNCVKHAKASKATLQLIAHESNLMLMLEDNGQGIAATSPQKNTDGGMGLKNIRDRINFIKGTLKMESNTGTGTTFIIETPL